MIVRNAARRAVFSDAKMAKTALGAASHLYAGLNCFLPGQQHAPHTHAGQDKLYYVLEGSGEAAVGEERREVAAGDLVLAPAGAVHSLMNTGAGPLVVLVVLSPPPVR